jgi:Matrixin
MAAVEMKMQMIVAIACLGLLMWVEPASAQSTYSLTVSHHRDIALSEDKVDQILSKASEILKKNSCDVTFKRKGSVRTFASADTPAIIETAADRDAVHSENSDVKVVKAIEFCRDNRDKGQAHDGCAWDPPRQGQRPRHRSMIVIPHQDTRLSGLVWAHEFGHRTGLWHRSEADALMTICPLDLDSKIPQEQVNRRECNCFLGGPGSCSPPEPAAECRIPGRR